MPKSDRLLARILHEWPIFSRSLGDFRIRPGLIVLGRVQRAVEAVEGTRATQIVA